MGANLLTHYLNITQEFKRIQELENPYSERTPESPIPNLIPTGSGESIVINNEINKAISSIARLIRQNDGTIKNRFAAKDWKSIIRQELGKQLYQLDLKNSDEDNAEKLKSTINEAIAQCEAKEIPSTEIMFATTWLNGPTDRFDLGPAKLESRMTWLQRQYNSNNISKITKRRLERRWQGKKLNPRKPSADSHNENDIINVLGELEHIISVEIAGFSNAFSENRAASIARLLLTVVALSWVTPSKTLRGLHLNYDDLPSRSSFLWLGNENRILASYHRVSLPFGPTINEQEWQDVCKDYEPVFRQAKEIANMLATNTYAPKKLHILRTLDLAIRWFHEGCRAQEDLLATTHYASALDTLAGGKKKKGILEILEKRVGWKSSMQIHIDGDNLGKIMKEIYEKTRSQFLHGSTKEYLGDGSDLRSIAEIICRHAIISCMIDADENPQLKDFHS